MKKRNQKKLCVGIGFQAAFLLWTLAVRVVDVQAIGPQGSVVGFATFNRAVHELTGVHLSLYTVTDWLGLVPLGFVMGFGMLGLVQWIRRRHIRRVDPSILVLGGFYVVVLAVFVLFEFLTVNYRPVLIEGRLEASYPSSTTMLVMCVVPTAILQLRTRFQNPVVRRIVITVLIAFSLFMVVGRLISGVHWCSDILGGALFSAGMVLVYDALSASYIRRGREAANN